MENKKLRWIYLIALSLIWGSSFILMKKALIGLTPIQVGALRIIITAVFLLLIGFNRLLKIEKRHWKYLILNALLGSFFPVFLFAFALQNIDSSIASILNALTPLNTLLFGATVFGFAFKRRQLIGVLIGFAGTAMLILEGAQIHPENEYLYMGFVIIASVGYAFNVNLIKKYLHDLDALSITVGIFAILIVPALMVLWFSGFFQSVEINSVTTTSLVYVSILAVVGTGIATIMFNRLIQLSTPVFSSSVTYLIPVVAITWGILDGEKISFLQFFSGLVILVGVYLANKAK
ncbi:MAG: DMT family transporter [Lutibacter sp.]|nr:DMT family transporter [Lutibacter sp.]MDP3360079.1 DMT family transporter [Lutibacter sp.]